jgi:hypothetical protein
MTKSLCGIVQSLLNQSCNKYSKDIIYIKNIKNHFLWKVNLLYLSHKNSSRNNLRIKIVHALVKRDVGMRFG